MCLLSGTSFWSRFPSPIRPSSSDGPPSVSGGNYNGTRPDIILMAVTSQFRKTVEIGEVWLTGWQGAGLLKPSAVKPVIATMEQRLILKKLRALGFDDQSALEPALDTIIGRRKGL